MALPVWTTPAGFLGTFTERKTSGAVVSASGVGNTYSIISGQLPPGTYMNTGGVIMGTPLSTKENANYKFVVRAANTSGIADRTFNIDLGAPTNPKWVTPAGLLHVGPNHEPYVFNNGWVDYQLRAESDVVPLYPSIRYYIAEGDGALPPGLGLAPNGRISGIVRDKLYSDSKMSYTGGFDDENWDNYAYDHGVFDAEGTLERQQPIAIPKVYQFYITATDEITTERRLFEIRVEQGDSLRVDNTLVSVDSAIYTASVDYIVPPYWQNAYGEFLPPVYNLGLFRGSRYEIIKLYTYDIYPFVGPVTYDWDVISNPEIQLITDSRTNMQNLPTVNKRTSNRLYFKDCNAPPLRGMKFRLSETLADADNTIYTVIDVGMETLHKGWINLDRPLTISVPDSTEIDVGSPSVHPPGLKLDSKTGNLYGTLNYTPTYTSTYKFTVNVVKTDIDKPTKTVTKSQIFTMTVKGVVDSYIEWKSPEYLGMLTPGEVCDLRVDAINSGTNYSISYSLVGGSLPSGLSLAYDGSIVGRINYQSQTYFDLSISGEGAFREDNYATTIDGSWYFVVRASDVYRVNYVDKEFRIRVVEDSLTKYNQIYVKPFFSSAKREEYRSFITDAFIFESGLIYRPNDPNFGVQPEMRMLIETGLEEVELSRYAGSMVNYFRRKKFYFGEVKYIVALDSNRKPLYELVYVDIVDTEMSGNTGIQDFTYQRTNPDTGERETLTYYANSVENMQASLEGIEVGGETISINKRLQPKYMSSMQMSTGLSLGYIKAIPICYAVPGESPTILRRIRASGFDFKLFNFDTDRIIISAAVDENQTTWLAYPQ